MSSQETIQSTRMIYEGRTITLKVHAVRLDDGRESTREIVEHPGAVAVIPLIPEGDLYLVRQFRLAAGGELLELPAGTLQPGEEPRAAAERELEEEVGVKADTFVELGSFLVSPGWATERITVFLATGLTPSEQHLDEDEVVDVVRLPMKDALVQAYSGRFHDAKTITGLLLAERWLKAEKGEG